MIVLLPIWHDKRETVRRVRQRIRAIMKWAIVKEDFGLSRVEFEMDEPVRFWGGIAGVIRNTVGRLQFTRTAEGAWVPKRIDIRLDLRIVFWNLRPRIVREWDEHTLVLKTDQ